MCLAVPLEIAKIEGDFAIVRAGSLSRKVNIQMLKNLKVGDYCLVHAGFAIKKIDPQAAKETLSILSQMRHA